MILSFKKINYIELNEKDETERSIGYSTFDNVLLIGRNSFYPNVLFYTQDKIITPYDEMILSLKKDSFYDNNMYDGHIDKSNPTQKISHSVFFFIYNFDNYYHFLYDTLPYLYTYLLIKQTNPDIKLLVNYPNKDHNKFYKFNEDILFKIVSKDDIIIHNSVNIYSSVYVSTSLTHGGFSNNHPKKEVFEIFDIIKSKLNYENIREPYNKPIKKIYVSRRTWINNDKSNIGTDYTTRRRMINEDELVTELVKKGFEEIFSENLTVDEKVYLFSHADEIVGSIGGGMSNLLFCKPNIKTYVIVSPYFLDINYRFKYSMEHTKIKYFYETEIYKKDNKVPLYCRVKITNIDSKYYNKIGEITDYTNEKYKISLSNNDVAGFNDSLYFESYLFEETDFILLDKGLNSPYIFDYKNLLLEL